jgi:hypothetical protein
MDAEQVANCTVLQGCNPSTLYGHYNFFVGGTFILGAVLSAELHLSVRRAQVHIAPCRRSFMVAAITPCHVPSNQLAESGNVDAFTHTARSKGGPQTQAPNPCITAWGSKAALGFPER